MKGEIENMDKFYRTYPYLSIVDGWVSLLEKHSGYQVPHQQYGVTIRAKSVNQANKKAEKVFGKKIFKKGSFNVAIEDEINLSTKNLLSGVNDVLILATGTQEVGNNSYYALNSETFKSVSELT